MKHLTNTIKNSIRIYFLKKKKKYKTKRVFENANIETNCQYSNLKKYSIYDFYKLNFKKCIKLFL